MMFGGGGIPPPYRDHAMNKKPWYLKTVELLAFVAVWSISMVVIGMAARANAELFMFGWRVLGW